MPDGASEVAGAEATGPAVALVLVSHSRSLARGVAELAGQMAPGVRIVPVGGTSDGGLGTDYDAIRDAIGEAVTTAPAVVVFGDLGSSQLTVEAVLEEEEFGGAVELANAPFVEGAVAGAVAAAGGGELAAVLASAGRAASAWVPPGGGANGTDPNAAAALAGAGVAADAGDGRATAVATVRNRLGLHARPAATLARLIAGLDARVTIDGVDGASVLELMQLGATGGRRLAVEATGAHAGDAVDIVVATIEGGFGEDVAPVS